MVTTAVHYAKEDPGSLVESCQRALEWILRTHRGRPIRRTWIDATNTEEKISLQEMEGKAGPPVAQRIGSGYHPSSGRAGRRSQHP